MAGGREGGLAIIKPACSALLAHAVRADVQQGGRGLSPEPSRLCDVRIKFEIEAWPAVKTAGDVGPFLDRAEAIAHASKVADETA